MRPALYHWAVQGSMSSVNVQCQCQCTHHCSELGTLYQSKLARDDTGYQLVYDLSTTCPQLIYNLSTTCLQLIYNLSTTDQHLIYNLSTPYVQLMQQDDEIYSSLSQEPLQHKIYAHQCAPSTSTTLQTWLAWPQQAWKTQQWAWLHNCNLIATVSSLQINSKSYFSKGLLSAHC
jgi:hypothetical protein